MSQSFTSLQDTTLATERQDIPFTFQPRRGVLPIKGAPILPVAPVKPKIATTAANPSGTGGIPKVLLSVNAVQTPVKQQTYTDCAVTVSFTRDTSDTNFDHVNIWFVGYHGSGTPTLMGSGVSSPITLIVDATKENVAVYAQTVSAAGQSADYSFATATSVTLSGVVGAAPAPTISQTLIATPLGYQFAFNQVALPVGDIDVVTAYRVYKNTSANTFAGSILNQTLTHDPTHLGAIVVQDNVGGGNTYYYFVTSVNSAGLESSAVSAQSGAIASGTASLTTDVVDGSTRFAQTASGLSYRPTSNPLTATDAGANATISIAAFTMRTSSKGDISLNSGSVTALSYGTLYYLYYDDPALAGGSSTYAATTTKETAINGAGRFYIGSIFTPTAGATATTGFNDGGTGGQIGKSLLGSAGTFVEGLTGAGIAWTNSSNILDGNTATKGTLTETGTSQTKSAFSVLSGFGVPTENYTSLALVIKSEVPTNNPTGAGGQTAGASIQYSLDGGITSTVLYTVGTGITRALTTDTIPLGTRQNINAIRVIVTASMNNLATGGSLVLDLYEATIIAKG